MTAATNPVLDPRGLVPFLPPKLEAAGHDFGIYGVEFLPLGVSARASATFTVAEDHAFLIVAANALLTTADNAIITPQEFLALVTLYRQGGPKANTQATVPGANDSPMDNWFGTGKQWAYWGLPYILAPHETLVVTLTNLEATARNYRLSFIGCRLYRSAVMDPWDFAKDGF